jgi:MYXO-CTERM domain-containing protein
VILTQAISRVIFCCRPHRKKSAFFRKTACAVLAAVLALPQLASATIVRMEISFGSTPAGNIDIELYDDQAPITVANFLRYAGRGDYTNNGFIHRHATINSSGVSVLQGGGYIYGDSPLGIFVTRIPVLDPPIKNEFSPLRSNIRGTIAMAKLGGQPDSATSEWYINIDDNSAALDDTNNSGGFTVFGRVLGDGMSVVDQIAGLDTWDARSINGALGELPLINFNPAIGLQPDNFVLVTRIPNVRSTRTELGTLATFTAGVDMVFDDVQTVPTNTALTWLTSFTSPPDQSVQFNNSMFSLEISGAMGANGLIVTLYDGAINRPTRYYAYGKTPDNQTDHWYDFSYDSATGTGAEIVGDKIYLHFVDGQRGDEDLIANNSITHTGAQAVVTTTGTTQSAQSGGCSIATTPSKTPRGGDWVMVSLFLGMLALVRRRARRQVQRERVTNIASP